VLLAAGIRGLARLIERGIDRAKRAYQQRHQASGRGRG
jgi:hypothetical protein